MSDDLVDRLRESLESSREVNAKLCQRRDDTDAEIERLRAERDEAITERDRLFIRGREWAELSGRMERERDALRARAERAEGRIASAPIAIMDTRDALGLCAPTEEDFPSLYALQGKTVALVVVND